MSCYIIITYKGKHVQYRYFPDLEREDVIYLGEYSVWQLCLKCWTIVSCMSVGKQLRGETDLSFPYLDEVILVCDLDISHCCVSTWHELLKI